jgi:hypothetical protein
LDFSPQKKAVIYFMIGMLIGLGLIFVGSIIVYFENKNEPGKFQLINLILDLNPFNLGPLSMVILGVIVFFISIFFK